MFILSDAGMGKTSLLVMLKLSYLSSFWPKSYNCELFKISEKSLEEIEKLENKTNTILLLDALDEDPLAWGRTGIRIAQVLRSTQNFRRVLITCRTQFLSIGEAPYTRRGQVEIAGFDCPVVYNSFFSEEQTQEYLLKRAAARTDSADWIEKAKAIATSMGSLRMRPMLLAHIDDFVEEGLTNWTEYTLYETLVRNWLKREQRKIRGSGEDYPELADLWKACRRLAIFLYQKKRKFATRAELHSLIQEVPEAKNIHLMNIGGRSLLNLDSSGRFRFSHYTIQEFLIVNAILEDAHPVNNYLVSSTDFMLRVLIAWRKEASAEQLASVDFTHFSLLGGKFSGKIMRNMDFAGLDLSCADFTASDLSNANFTGSNLAGCKFLGATLNNANFHSANLTSASLNSCQAAGAQFQWATLIDASLINCNFSKANFAYATLTGAVHSSGTVWPTLFKAEISASREVE